MFILGKKGSWGQVESIASHLQLQTFPCPCLDEMHTNSNISEGQKNIKEKIFYPRLCSHWIDDKYVETNRKKDIKALLPWKKKKVFIRHDCRIQLQLIKSVKMCFCWFNFLNSYISLVQYTFLNECPCKKVDLSSHLCQFLDLAVGLETQQLSMLLGIELAPGMA